MKWTVKSEPQQIKLVNNGEESMTINTWQITNEFGEVILCNNHDAQSRVAERLISVGDEVDFNI